VVIKLNRVGPGTPGPDEGSLGHPPPLQAEGQMGLLLADHVVVAAVLGLDGGLVRLLWSKLSNFSSYGPNKLEH